MGQLNGAAALIIAGGHGMRFWPASRQSSPKPLFHLSPDRTLLADTISRHQPMIPAKRIFVLISAAQRAPFERALEGLLGRENLLIEPHPRGTAVAIAYGAGLIRARLGEVTLVVAPADHYVSPASAFRRTLAAAVELASRNQALVVIGVRPSRPDSGYGYQQVGAAVGGGFRVQRFVEKPAPAAARAMVRSGHFLWNSGVFVMTTATLERELTAHCPALAAMMRKSARRPARIGSGAYARLSFKSFDYEVLEKSSLVLGVRARYKWHDVGSWEGLWETLRGPGRNALSGNVVTLDSRGVLARSDGRLMVLLGVDDLVAVETPDAVLIARRSRSHDVKRVFEELSRRGLSRYL